MLSMPAWIHLAQTWDALYHPPDFVPTTEDTMGNRMRDLCLMLTSVAILCGVNRSFAQSEARHANSWQAIPKFPPNRHLGSNDLLPASGQPKVKLLSGDTSVGTYTLPNTHGQEWREYDIRHFTYRHANKEKPEQIIVDWILRETGTEMWFSQPMGVLNADRDTLRVYHTREVQRIVQETIDRFQRPSTENFMFGVRMLTLASPNWRTRALPRLTPVPVQTPGVEAWLTSQEDAAVILAELRKRTDFREHNSPNLLIRNGNTHQIDRMRPVAYLRGGQNGQYGPGMDMGRVMEGFTLEISPLISIDAQNIDAVVKINSNQIERMKSVAVAAPSADNQRRMLEVQVPQTSSWRLHERFHWPANQVIVISCGVVSSPGPERRTPLQRVTSLMPRAPRSDALLFIDAKGRMEGALANGQPCDPTYQANSSGSDLNYRGRY